MMQDMQAESGSARSQKVRTPPYVAYKTFLTFVGDLKMNGVPPQIDRSVLNRFAGGVQGQIMLALRSLELIDGENKPSDKLHTLVDAYETENFKSQMRQVIEATYPYVLRLDLMTATPTMFSDAFKEAIDAKEDVLRKCRTFFLHAAKELDIPVGPRIAKAQFSKGRSNGARKPRASKAAEALQPVAPADLASRAEEPGTVLTQLLAKFPDFDPSWPDEIKAKWFAGFDQFMRGAKVTGG